MSQLYRNSTVRCIAVCPAFVLIKVAIVWYTINLTKLTIQLSFPDMYNHRVLHYNFESMTSQQVFDVSGNGNSADMSDEDIRKREGKCGSGILFNYSLPLEITMPGSTTHKVLSKLEITVAAWIYLNKVYYTLYCKMHIH